MGDKCEACGTPLELCLQENTTWTLSGEMPLYNHCCVNCTHARDVLAARFEEVAYRKAVELVQEDGGARACRQGSSIALVVDDPQHVQGLLYRVDLDPDAAARLYAQLAWLFPSVRTTKPNAKKETVRGSTYARSPHVASSADAPLMFRAGESVVRCVRCNRFTLEASLCIEPEESRSVFVVGPCCPSCPRWLVVEVMEQLGLKRATWTLASTELEAEQRGDWEMPR
jgi:hypothetical protein